MIELSKKEILVVGVTALIVSCKINYVEKTQGTWVYKYGPFKGDSVVNMDAKHYEYIGDEGCYFEYDIEWQDKRTYIATYVKNSCGKIPVISVGESAKVEVLKVNDSILEYQVYFNGVIEKNTMYRLR
jgi:hypothetical protein